MISPSKRIVVVTAFIVVIIALLPDRVFLSVFRAPLTDAPMTGEAFIKRAGGAERLNRDAAVLLAKYGDGEAHTLSRADRDAFLGFTALGGTSVAICPEANKTPSHVSIRYGDSWHPGSIYIFATNKDIPPDWSLAMAQISSNIFASRKEIPSHGAH